jgi:hypothetical protein
MKKPLSNQEARVVQYLVKRKNVATENIARVTGGTYKQGANLLLRMEKEGVLIKVKRGVYALKNKETITLQSEIKFRKPRVTKEKKQASPEMLARLKRMRDIRERNRQERILQQEEKKLNASRTLVGYKLIKQYPHSPYQIGDVFDTTDSGDYTLYEMYPELWQPIYKVIKPEPKQLTDEQKDLLREATEYVAVAMGLIKKIESLNDNTNN